MEIFFHASNLKFEACNFKIPRVEKKFEAWKKIRGMEFLEERTQCEGKRGKRGKVQTLSFGKKKTLAGKPFQP